MKKWELSARGLAEECAEKIGCHDEGSHPCILDEGFSCGLCWLAKAERETEDREERKK